MVEDALGSVVHTHNPHFVSAVLGTLNLEDRERLLMEPEFREQIRIYLPHSIIVWMKEQQTNTGMSLSKQIAIAIEERMQDGSQ